MNSIIQQINGTSVTGIMCGLISITDLVKNGEPVLEEANLIFEALCPKLKHNNYKIRTMAFALMEYLLLKSFDLIANPQDALTKIIFGLSSVNKEIKQSSKVCVRIIITRLPTRLWWKTVEKSISNTKSKETEYELLSILAEIKREVPLKTIIPMFDSPDVNVRKYSDEIVKNSSGEKIAAALSKCKVSYQSYKIIKDIIEEKEKKNTELIQEEAAPIPKQVITAEPLYEEDEESQFEDDEKQQQNAMESVQKVTQNNENEQHSVSSLLKDHLMNDKEDDSESLQFESESKKDQEKCGFADLSSLEESDESVKSLHSIENGIFSSKLNEESRSRRSASVKSNINDNASIRSSHKDNLSIRSERSKAGSIRSALVKSKHADNASIRSSHKDNASIRSSHKDNESIRSIHKDNESIRSIHKDNESIRSIHKDNESIRSERSNADIIADNASFRSQRSKANSRRSASVKSRHADNESIRSERSKADIIADNASIRSNRIDNASMRSGRSNVDMISDNVSMRSNHADNESIRSKRSASVRSKHPDNESIRSKRSVISSRRAANDDMESVRSTASRRNMNIVGRITIKPARKLQFRLRDLSGKAWLERLTFLEYLDEELDSSLCNTLKGDDVMKCILSGIVPVHKKLTFVSISVLKKAIGYFPESLKNNLPDVIGFVLSIYKEFEEDETFQELISILVQESEKSALVDAAVACELQKNRPVNSMSLILDVYRVCPSTVLSPKTICNVIGFILREKRISKNSGIIIENICKNQRDQFIKYYMVQQPRIQSLLRPFIPRVKVQKPTKKAKDDMAIITGNMANDDLLEIIKYESRKGDAANINTMVEAYERYSVDDVKELARLFIIFIKFLTKISEDFYESNDEAVFKIASIHFASSTVIKVVNTKLFDQRYLVGLSRFVWCCPSSALAKSQEIYATLYEIFCHSDGKTRLLIVQITIAIEKATGLKWVSSADINPVHQTLINKLYQQFDIE